MEHSVEATQTWERVIEIMSGLPVVVSMTPIFLCDKAVSNIEQYFSGLMYYVLGISLSGQTAKSNDRLPTRAKIGWFIRFNLHRVCGNHCSCH